jgi:hypothetical protein
MRILLQSFETGLYLDTSGDWANNSDLAWSFPSTRQAADLKFQRRLAKAFVVVLPEPAPPLSVTGGHDETTSHAQEPANPVDSPVKATLVKMRREGRSARRKPAMASYHSHSNHRPYTISI